jgi:hypothetical protein
LSRHSSYFRECQSLPFTMEAAPVQFYTRSSFNSPPPDALMLSAGAVSVSRCSRAGLMAFQPHTALTGELRRGTMLPMFPDLRWLDSLAAPRKLGKNRPPAAQVVGERTWQPNMQLQSIGARATSTH